jgi:hypothetical protein
MSREWHRGELNIARFNYGVLTLLPKCVDASMIQQYRLICLLNVMFKVFTKVTNNRAIEVADKIISPVQTAFIKECFILDGVVVLHEVMHHLHKKKSNAILFKVDFCRIT